MEEQNVEKWIPFEVVEGFMQAVLVKAGVPATDAAVVADVLISADKFGFDSHGANRLKPIYLDRIREGILDPISRPVVVRDKMAVAVLDGHNGMGHVIARKAMEIAMEKASVYGMGMVAVRNSTHFGIAGYYALMAAQRGMIGISGTNARPSVAPTFSVENMFGTNPLTFAMPSDEAFPFLLDCATSIIQRGQVELYAREGKDLAPDLVIGHDGKTRTHSASILEEFNQGLAALCPLGGIGEETAGYKGYGYATVVEILSAALQGGAFLKMLTGLENGKKVPIALGHFFIAIDVSFFTEEQLFRKTTGDILRQLRAARKMPGQDRIFTAGEKEYDTWLYRKDKGVPFSKPLLLEFSQLAAAYGLDSYQNIFSE